MKALGYATCCIGKWHLGEGKAYRPTARGFDEFYGCRKSKEMTFSAIGTAQKALSPENADASAFRQLPSAHKDPFDRMLAAQALVEGLTLVTRDKVTRQYELPLIDA